MKVDTVAKLMDSYVQWWRDNIDFVQEGNAVRIICPMLNRDNDHMSIYLIDDIETSGFILTDIGETLSDLQASGFDILGSDKRREKFEQTLRGYGIQNQGMELYTRAGRDSLFPKLNMLMQSMASVDDMFYMAQNGSRSFILDDVAKWLDNNNIRYMPNIKIAGKS